ncbi:MAG: TlpA family protein disulfide reductase [Candidatus Rokuibacteriota bacterium]
MIGRRWSWLAGGALAVVLCGPAGAERTALAPLLGPLDLRGYARGTTPPAFDGRTLDGRLSMKDVRGQVILLNFWASWCAECRPEMPVLERLHRELGPRGLAVVGINAREEAVAVRRYARELRLTFPLLLDPGGTVNNQYGVVGLPTTFLIGRDGRAVVFAVGARDWGGAPARALIEALLAEPAPRPEAR